MSDKTLNTLPEVKHTVCLPKTDFSMRAGLPQLEERLLQRWSDQGLWRAIRDQSRGREKFILHDGPPYANGHLHIGHALNKILKDVINRQHQKMGFDANYVPGWDCHGLPIEWKIEEQYRANNQDKNAIPINEFRDECRDFATHWMEVQRKEFIRLGVFGDWENPYNTMTYAAEATIVNELGKFLMHDYIVRRERPVMWSVVEQTALADAEIEYHELKSPSIMVRFPVVESPLAVLRGAQVVIWTTTPWTIPCNRAISVKPNIEYSVITVEAVAEESLAVVGEVLLLASDCVAAVTQQTGITHYRRQAAVSAQELAGTIAAHPLSSDGFDHPVPVLFADYVNTEQGTGCVHTAPGHGADDYATCQKHGIDTPITVMADGSYHESVPLMQGHQVITAEGEYGSANGFVIKKLLEAGQLVHKTSVRHQYPHSWRSKKPVIYRATAQWFISIDHQGLRDTVLAEIDRVTFTPSAGQLRLRSLIETRPDWCISRQRAWGVPIAIFVDKRTGQPLKDMAVMQNIVAAFAQEGANCWYDSPPERFLGSAYAPDDYEQIFDVVDVWFDSGSSHAFVLEAREALQSPASLYLEGSDQHRGFFHSSILQSCGTRGRAPYDAVLTHGFVLDEHGKKMSKSLGNIVSPQDISDQHGAEILRLWVATLDYSGDVRIGQQILKGVIDIYRRFRNTLRWLMGNLHYYDANRQLTVENMPLLERFILHRLYQLDATLRQAHTQYDLQSVVRELFQLCNQDLSAFYFDVRKDSLYCDARDDYKRLAALSMSAILFDLLTVWLSPILCFTTEEAWLAQTGEEKGNSVHLRDYPLIPQSWYQPDLAARWDKVMLVRKVVLSALEYQRQDGMIKSSLEASIAIAVDDASLYDALDGIDMAELCIVSAATVSRGKPAGEMHTLDDVSPVGVKVMLATGDKCQRCWKVTDCDEELVPETMICKRCQGVLSRDFAF